MVVVQHLLASQRKVRYIFIDIVHCLQQMDCPLCPRWPCMGVCQHSSSLTQAQWPLGCCLQQEQATEHQLLVSMSMPVKSTNAFKILKAICRTFSSAALPAAQSVDVSKQRGHWMRCSKQALLAVKLNTAMAEEHLQALAACSAWACMGKSSLLLCCIRCVLNPRHATKSQCSCLWSQHSPSSAVSQISMWLWLLW